MRLRTLLKLVVASGMIGALALFLVPGMNPFRAQTVDSSGPVLVRSIQDMQRYVPAQGTYEVAVVLREQVNGLPTFLYGYEGVLVAHGTVDAVVDFSDVRTDAVTVAPVGGTVTVRLPAPRLGPPLIDHRTSQVVDDNNGLLNAMAARFGGNGDDRTPDLYRAAETKISAAAAQSDLLGRAQQNTAAMLNDLGRAVGFTRVEVTFAPAAA